MSWSVDNRALIFRKLGREMSADQKVTLTGKSLAAIVEAARKEGAASVPRSSGGDATSDFMEMLRKGMKK